MDKSTLKQILGSILLLGAVGSFLYGWGWLCIHDFGFALATFIIIAPIIIIGLLEGFFSVLDWLFNEN